MTLQRATATAVHGIRRASTIALIAPLRGLTSRFLGWLDVIGQFSSVLAHGMVPGNWRRTMRKEFSFYLYQVGFRAIPVVLVAAALVGIGMIVQVIYWLGFTGQDEHIGEFIVLALVRQIAPVATVLIVIGRSGSVLVDEIGQLSRTGHLRLLASQGIEPTEFITIPRAFAVAAASFLLTLVFLHTALWSGYLAASVAGLAKASPVDFITGVTSSMSMKDHLLLVAKPLLTGYVVGYISVWFGSRADPGPHGRSRALPKAFVTSLISTFVIGALLTALL